MGDILQIDSRHGFLFISNKEALGYRNLTHACMLWRRRESDDDDDDDDDKRQRTNATAVAGRSRGVGVDEMRCEQTQSTPCTEQRQILQASRHLTLARD